MTTPRDPTGSDRGPWDGAEDPPIHRHPEFDRYPPPTRPFPALNADHRWGQPADGANQRRARRVFPWRPEPPRLPEPPRPAGPQGPLESQRLPNSQPPQDAQRPQDTRHPQNSQHPQDTPRSRDVQHQPDSQRPQNTARPQDPTRPQDTRHPQNSQHPEDSQRQQETQRLAGSQRLPDAQRRPETSRAPEPPYPLDGQRPPDTRPLADAQHPLDVQQRTETQHLPDVRQSPETQRFGEVPQPESAEPPAGKQRIPRKLTVTRVAVMRGRELTGKGIATFQRAAKADGADKSGLTALTYATMTNFALDAAIAVALANTLFFASATAESKSKVALYLLITIAPFAVIAPLIGPLLDRLQHGRRVALASSFAARAVVAVMLIFQFNNVALYPLALCMMVGSKSFSVLKSAVTPRVLPPEIDLVRTNSRLTVFGLVGGTIGAGSVAALAAVIAGSNGALILAVLIAVAGTYLSLRIPSWVEVTEGEVPTTLGYHGEQARTEVIQQVPDVPARRRRQPLGRSVVTGLWGNSAIRVLTGFLTFYVAFVAKATEHRPVQQATMLGIVGAAAAIGNFTGNATGARLKLGRPSLIVVGCTAACTLVAVFAILADNLLGAAIATLVASGASALAKVSLDAAIQDDLPPESIASGFGRSETVLQLSWVIGGAAGVLLPTEWWKGFAVVSAILVLGLTQTYLSYRGHTLLPFMSGNRPQHVEQKLPGKTTFIPRPTGDPLSE